MQLTTDDDLTRLRGWGCGCVAIQVLGLRRERREERGERRDERVMGEVRRGFIRAA